MSLEGPLSPLVRCIILPFVMHFVPDLVKECGTKEIHKLNFNYTIIFN